MLQRQSGVCVCHAGLDDIGSQPRQMGDPAGLSSVDAFNGGDLGDRQVLALIEEALPVMRQPKRPNQWCVLCDLIFPSLQRSFDRELLRRINWRDDLSPNPAFD